MLVEIGRLSSQMAANTEAVAKLGAKLGAVEESVASVRVIVSTLRWVAIILTAVVTPVIAFVWPYRHKLFALLSTPP